MPNIHRMIAESNGWEFLADSDVIDGWVGERSGIVHRATHDGNADPAFTNDAVYRTWVACCEEALGIKLEQDQVNAIDAALDASRSLFEAYETGEANGGSVDWEDVNIAYGHACDALTDEEKAEIKARIYGDDANLASMAL